MNALGKEFIKKQSARYQAACAKKPDVKPRWKDHSNIEERAMRLGIENRVYELELVSGQPLADVRRLRADGNSYVEARLRRQGIRK